MNIPAQNIEAEESVLGTMLMSWKAIEAAAEVLRPEDFYKPSHGHIFRAALDLHTESKPVDALTVADELDKRGQLDMVGGPPKIHELVNLVPAASNAKHYAKIVAEQSGARRLQRAGERIVKLAVERRGDLDELIEEAENAMVEALASTQVSEFESVASLNSEFADEIERVYESGEGKTGLLTHYRDLDDLLTGLYAGCLYIIAARPGMGKSTLALNIAENIAYKGTAAGIVSLEMSREELLTKQYSRVGQINSVAVRTGRFTPPEYESFKRAREIIAARDNLYIDDSPGVTSANLRASARRLHRQGGLGVLIVDYIQLMLSSGNADSRQQEVADISRSLKLLAKELNIPIIALSQLNRNLENRDDKRPRLSDLRDSGALEQDADAVLFIYRDEKYHPDTPDIGVAEVNVAKNRMGAGGEVRLTFTGKYNTFKTPHKEAADE